MGLFDKLRAAGTAVPSFDAQRAVMTIVVAAVKADGAVSRDERLRVASICSGTQLFASNSSDEDSAVIEFADTVTDQFGDAAIDHAAKDLKPGLRETAFALATDMVLADGVLSEREEDYLTKLAGRLSISEHVVNVVVEATIIRNRKE